MLIARIKYGKIPYSLPEGEHSGTNLHAFFGVPKSHHLWVEDKDSGGDVRIDATDTPFHVSNGDRFYTAAKKINQG